MAVNYPRHFLLQWGGHFNGGGASFEQWTNTIRFTRSSALIAPAMDNLLDDVQADVQAWHTRATSNISSVVKLDFVKFNEIGTDGKYEQAVTYQKVFTTPVAGGNTTFSNPLQVAMAVSLRTAKRGPRYRGRFFIPCPAVVLDPNTFKVSTAIRDQVCSSAQTFLQALGNWPGLDTFSAPKVAVLSGGGKFSGTGSAEVVTAVRVGDVYDTIRSRRRQLGETYKELPVSQ